MAARENQGYLIAVIILVLLTLVLALAAFLGLSKASENATSRAAAEDKAKQLEKVVKAHEDQADILKAYIGGLDVTVAEANGALQSLKQGGGDPGVQLVLDEILKIEAIYKKDMVGSTTTEEGQPVQEPTWRSRIDSLTSLVSKQVNDNAVQVRLTANSEAEAQSKIEEMKSTLAAAQKNLADTKSKLAEVTRNSLANEAELQGELDEAVAGNEATNKQFQAFQTTSSKTIRDLNEDRAEVETKNQGLKKRINLYEREVFDRPDGQIVRVAARMRSCMIDIGSADGLTTNRTFSIYSQDETNFDKGKHKAKIEVTRVYPYQAEARITEEDPTNPILSGDHILTATWDPGNSVSIALTGVFDLDGDRYDDRDKLAQMIVRNGGKVVATHDDEGNMIGKIDPTVRYLVVGTPPSLAEDASDGSKRNSSAINTVMRDMQDLAKENTVDRIDLQKLLNRMGVRAMPKTLQIEPRFGGFPKRSPSDAGKE